MVPLRRRNKSASPTDEASRSFSKDDRDKFLILISDEEDLEGEGLKRAKKLPSKE